MEQSAFLRGLPMVVKSHDKLSELLSNVYLSLEIFSQLLIIKLFELEGVITCNHIFSTNLCTFGFFFLTGVVKTKKWSRFRSYIVVSQNIVKKKLA